MKSHVELVIETHNGEFHVFLDPGGEHIVTKRIVSGSGEIIAIQVPWGTEPWDRAVRRAVHAIAFL